MSTIQVFNLYDSGAGSLRQAILDANPGDTIDFVGTLAGGTLTLTSGALDITKNLTIDGDIAHNGTPAITISGGGTSRVFDVANGSNSGNPISATLNALTIEGGYVKGANGGGIAVGSYDSVTVSDSRVTGNSAVYVAGPDGGEGGAIYVNGASGASSLTLLNTAIDHNSAGLGGGGVSGSFSNLYVVDSTLSANTVTGHSGLGGAVSINQGNLTLINATLSGNSADIGGAITQNFSSGKIYDSTLTGNATQVLGAILDNHGSLTLSNSIVAGNTSSGPGIDVDVNAGSLTFDGNNILGSSPATATSTVQGSYSPIDGTSGAALATVFARVGYNPNTGVLSGVLADNGGPVRTVAINPAGIAYNAGSNAAVPGNLLTDARGFARVVGGTVDIGAFEQQQGTTFVVTTLSDDPLAPGLSLRHAIALANQDPTSADTITFAPNLVGGNIAGVNDGFLALSNGNGALTINGNVTIDGDVNGHEITIGQQDLASDFVITGGTVALNNLRITGGYAYRGGGVLLAHGSYAPANVTISNSYLANDQAAFGGGIYVDPGDSLQLINSTITESRAAYVGGAIANKGTLVLRGTTVSVNQSGYLGGGIANAGLLYAVNSTISDNLIINNRGGPTYASAGGGLYNSYIAALANTTISHNTGAYAGGGIYNKETLGLINATIANNSAYNGGGLENAPCGCGYAKLYDSTFTGNYANQFGGGIYNANGTVILTNNLVAGNRAGYQGSDLASGSSATTNYTGVNLFSQAGVGRPGIDITQPDLARIFASLTTVDPDSVPNSGDEFQAGLLANNGGPVETVAIKLGGSAQDTGSTADLPPDFFDLNNNGDTSEPLPVDGRGLPRVFGKAVDIGAFEAQRSPETVPFDLNGDANSDLVFQDNGQPGIWLMNGATPIAEAGLGNPGPSWHIITSRDLNGDGNADLIWQNSDGTPGIWLMNGTTPIAEAGLGNPGASWRIVASGDLNGDGRADLIWQNTDGTLGVWLMNGTTPTAQAGIGNPGPNWKVVGSADFSGDGNDDILLQNTATGNLMIDVMNGMSIASSVSITVGDPSWHAVSTGEFNGQAEIAWQNNNGTVGLWLMNGTSAGAEAALPSPGAGWQLLSIDHFTPNGQADLLFQNTSGPLLLWEMNGTSIAAQVNPPNPTAAWQSVNGHPFASG